MAYKYSFADNEIYGASDINAITKRLVTSGVEDSFTDGVAYNASRFNDAGKLLYTSGAVPESYLSLKVEDAGDGKILINPGKAFFDDGAVIEIEEGGETLPYVSGSKNYVYLKNDLINTNRCYPCCTVAEPEGDYVLLAEIDANGAITDKRTYARGKLPGYQSVAERVLVIDETVSKVAEASEKYLRGSVTFDIGNNNYEYILVMTPYKGSTSNMPCIGVYNIVDKTYLCYSGTDVSSVNYAPTKGAYSANKVTSHTDVNHDDYTELTFSVEDGKLTVNYLEYDYQSNFKTGSTYYTRIKLFLF